MTWLWISLVIAVFGLGVYFAPKVRAYLKWKRTIAKNCARVEALNAVQILDKAAERSKTWVNKNL